MRLLICHGESPYYSVVVQGIYKALPLFYSLCASCRSLQQKGPRRSISEKKKMEFCNKIHEKKPQNKTFNCLYMSSKCSKGSKTVKELLGSWKSWLFFFFVNLFFFLKATGAAGRNVFRICHDYVTSPSGKEPLCIVWREEALWKQGKSSEDHLHKAVRLWQLALALRRCSIQDRPQPLCQIV